MECLRDWIGIENCASTAPSNSGFYINTLAGISQAQMASIANSEQSTFLGVWGDIQDRAVLRFKNDYNNYMMQRFRKSDAVTTFKINKMLLNTATTTGVTADYLGVMIGTDPNASPLLAVSVQEVNFYLIAVNGDVTIRIYDVTDDKEVNVLLDSFTIAAADLVVGWNKKYINKLYYDSINLFVGFSHANYVSPTTTIASDFYSNNGGYLKGARFTSVGDSLTLGQNTFGISVTASLQCRYEAYACQNLELFTYAWLNLLGAELMKERMFTDQINTYTTVNRDQAKALRDLYEGDYSAQLQLVVSGIHLNCDQCIECGSQVSSVNNLP